jgi:hypothetical protein
MFLFLMSFTRDIQKEDLSYNVAKYGLSTTTGTLHSHLLKFHLQAYITTLEQHKLKVAAKEIWDLLDVGWTLTLIGQELDQNPDKSLELFGFPPPPPGWVLLHKLGQEGRHQQMRYQTSPLRRCTGNLSSSL